MFVEPTEVAATAAPPQRESLSCIVREITKSNPGLSTHKITQKVRARRPDTTKREVQHILWSDPDFKPPKEPYTKGDTCFVVVVLGIVFVCFAVALVLLWWQPAPLDSVQMQVHNSAAAILSETECKASIDAAERRAASQGGWTNTRHAVHPTYDLPVSALGATGRSITSAIEKVLMPELAEKFRLHVAGLTIDQLFITKYSTVRHLWFLRQYPGISATDPVHTRVTQALQAGLGHHEDGSDYSFVLALNSPTYEYQGGGTHFLSPKVTSKVFRPALGHATLFHGRNRHRGVPVSQGTRYVLAGFLFYREPF
jgi:hypothetical protein